jgi:hypothetical protein
VLLAQDRGYSNAPWLLATQNLDGDNVIRARKDQVLFRPAPARTNRSERPRLDGKRFKGSDPTPHGPPDNEWSGSDATGQPVQVSVWRNLHRRKARHITITVISWFHALRGSVTSAKCVCMLSPCVSMGRLLRSLVAAAILPHLPAFSLLCIRTR